MSILNHGNIIKPFGIVEYPDGFGIVMECAEGGNLEDLLYLNRQKEICLSRKMEILQQIVDALVYIHEREHPIVHGDLKPQNILIMSDNKIKLADFGSSNVINASGIVGSFPSKQCTIPYAAPEFLKNANIIRSTAEDVYG